MGDRLIPRCPDCAAEVAIWKRVCFGPDPHNEYRCSTYLCGWSGRRPSYNLPDAEGGPRG